MKAIKIISILLTIFSVQSVFLLSKATAETTLSKRLEIAQSNSEKITEEKVEALIDNLKNAIESRNLEEIIPYFSPYIVSAITIKADSISETIELNGIGEHRQYLEAQFNKIQETNQLFEDWEIIISGDEQIAFITRTRNTDVMTTDGRNVLVHSKAKARLGIVEGELKIISIEEVLDVALRVSN